MAETAEQYIQKILGHVEGRDALQVQRSTSANLKKLTRGLTPRQLKWKPEAGKWSIAEIVAHLADTEIVASWRLRSVIGANGITIQPYDQNVWADVFRYAEADVNHAIETFRVLRENNLKMLKALPPTAWDNYGMHLERGKETLVHLTRMFAGHDTNHLRQIEALAAEIRKTKTNTVKKTKAKKTNQKKHRR
jgi:DinB family protein